MNNWYKIALEDERLRILAQQDLMTKEAGLAEIIKSIPAWIIAAVLAVNSGMAAETAKDNIANRYNLTSSQKAQLNQTLSNREQVNKITKSIQNAQNRVNMNKHKHTPEKTKTVCPTTPITKMNLDFDTFINKVQIQEGLVPKQTPFRITHPSMEKWNSLFGYEIDHGPKPAGREKHLFFKHQEDVFKAIKQQFVNYANNPSKYGLKDNPSIGDTLQKFVGDKTGIKNKLDYLKKTIPNFDPNVPIKSIM